jgi:hypothetical protein
MLERIPKNFRKAKNLLFQPPVITLPSFLFLPPAPHYVNDFGFILIYSVQYKTLLIRDLEKVFACKGFYSSKQIHDRSSI